MIQCILKALSTRTSLMRIFFQPLLALVRVPRPSKKAQTLVEYALILAMMSVLAIAIYTLLNGQIERIFSVIANQLDTSQACNG